MSSFRMSVGMLNPLMPYFLLVIFLLVRILTSYLYQLIDIHWGQSIWRRCHKSPEDKSLRFYVSFTIFSHIFSFFSYYSFFFLFWQSCIFFFLLPFRLHYACSKLTSRVLLLLFKHAWSLLSYFYDFCHFLRTLDTSGKCLYKEPVF